MGLLFAPLDRSFHACVATLLDSVIAALAINEVEKCRWANLLNSQEFSDTDGEFRDTHGLSLDSALPVLHAL